MAGILISDTMGRILENWRVFAAGLFAVVLIGGAYVFARGIQSPPAAEASTETAILKAIATKDSDADGLPDWEEVLYGADPHNQDTFTLGMTDGEAAAKGLIVPKAIADVKVTTPLSGGSLQDLSPNSIDNSLPSAPTDDTITAAFAKNFFSLYMAAKAARGSADLSESDLNDIANQAIQSLSDSIVAAPDFKSAHDLTVSGSGAGTLKAFAISAEAVLLKNTSNATKSEVLYLQDFVEGGDAAAITYITALAKVYRDSATGLAVLPVPEELVADHLALVNAMERVSEITADFTRVDTDPLATILALQQYPQAVMALGTAFINIGNIYKTAGESIPAGARGASFVNMIPDIEAQQKASATKP